MRGRFVSMIWVLALALTTTAVSFGADGAVVAEQTPPDGSMKPGVDATFLAEQLVLSSGWEFAEDIQPRDIPPQLHPRSFHGHIRNFEREVLVDNIAHYSYDVRIGGGTHDVIRLHRVVKERRPYRPVRSKRNIFLLHGDAVGFVKFLFGAASPSTPDEQSAAIYLAQRGVDVWGMDQDWILVPGDTSDFSFMADWGLQRQIDNVDVALRIARLTRLFTGNGYRKMNLLGYSSGAVTAYAMANQETRIPMWRRQVGGLIPVDVPFKLDPSDEAAHEFACGYAAGLQTLMDSGMYQDETGLLLQTLGYLARTDPDGDSPVIPGLTNLQTGLLFMGATYNFFPLTDSLHYMGGVFDENGLPTGLEYTTMGGFLDFLDSAAPFEPNKFLFDYASLWCYDDLPFDDHLEQVTVPVFYISVAGGVGEAGHYSTTLLGSDDVTLISPHLRPPEEILLDIGHVDIWTAESARELYWEPLLNWVVDHTSSH